MELVGRTWRTLILINIEAALLPRTDGRRPEKLLRFSLISCLSTYVKPWNFFFSPLNGGIVFSQNLDPFLGKKLFLTTPRTELNLGIIGNFPRELFLA